MSRPFKYQVCLVGMIGILATTVPSCHSYMESKLSLRADLSRSICHRLRSTWHDPKFFQPHITLLRRDRSCFA